MKPKWQKLASLAQEICTLWFQFFSTVFASKGYPFKNIFEIQTYLIQIRPDILSGLIWIKLFRSLSANNHSRQTVYMFSIRTIFSCAGQLTLLSASRRLYRNTYTLSNIIPVFVEKIGLII